MYLNISNILSKNATWNIIETERGTGKTYGTQNLVLKNCIKKNRELVYIARTIGEKDDGVLQQAFQKVIDNEFKDYEFYFELDEFGIIENGKRRRLAVCIALSEAHKIKKKSYPKVYWIIFDELQLETSSTVRYVNGYKEPDLLLSIYHTIDREEGRTRVIMLTNSINVINPYYIHGFFNIKGYKEINKYYIKNDVLYIHATASDELKKKRQENQFIKKVLKLTYGKYITSENLEGNNNFILERDIKSILYFNIVIEGNFYGVWFDTHKPYLIISKKHNKKDVSISLDLESHTENTILFNNKNTYCTHFKTMLLKNLIRYEDLEVKTLTEKSLYKIL